MLKVAIVFFDDFEILDACGPYEVFTTANDMGNESLCDVYAVSAADLSVRSVNGLNVECKYLLADCPDSDIVIVPGGIGTRQLLTEQRFLAWLQQESRRGAIIFSVCTGALLLAKAGLLSGLSVTTHHSAFALLKELEPTVEIMPQKRFVDNERIITSGGITAGIDAALYLVGKFGGQALAQAVAREMEYTIQN